MPEVKLNPEQREAVEHREGPLLVVAGPGSGKTRVITERIVYLLENLPTLGAENILAVTFTDKAAGEMKARVRRALGEPPAQPHISTFHSFCHHVLRERHFERRLLDKVDVWIFLRQRMERLGLDFYLKLAEPGAFLHDLNEFFSRCQDELIEPEDFEAFVAKLEMAFLRRANQLDPAERKLEEEEIQKLEELGRVFRNSRRLLEEAGCSSFGTLIPETVRLLDREPELLERYRARFKYVLVDEFQDTNYAQVELLRRLVAPPYNITAVGDDDQAIYRFRGASHGAFKMFEERFKPYKTVYLNRNYRSTKKVLRVVNAVIEKNRAVSGGTKKPSLKTDNEEGPAVSLLQSPDFRSEAAWIAEEIARRASRGTPYGAVAALYRAHNHRDLLVEEFRRRGIPFAVRGLSVLSTVILRDLVAYLNLIHSPHDNISLTRVLLAGRWRFSEDLALEIRRKAGEGRCSICQALENLEQTLFKKDLEATGWPELKRLIASLHRMAEGAPVTKLFDRLMESLELTFLPGERDQVYVQAFRKFFEHWEKKSETGKFNEFMEYFRYFLDAGGKIEAPESEGASNAVQLMTVHSAKGLEFPAVFILSVAPQRFPHREQKPVIEFPDELRRSPIPPGDIHLQEERRLFYVGMTRAKERLYVSSVSKPGRKPSAFSEDLLSNPAVAARDIERIQVPEISGEVEPPAASRAPSAQRDEAQPGLFGDAARLDCVHPPLADWASRAPMIRSNEKLQLSASAIETYQDCPLKFKFIHYEKIPTGPQPALTFGNIMHQCVRRYFELRAKSLPRFEEIEEFYLCSWRDAGFEDAYQEQTYKKAGLEQLRQFVEAQNARPAPDGKIEMEKHFRIDLGDVVLEGRIDQVTPLTDGEVELVDYKTGRPRTQKEAEKSLQLSVYALAAREALKLEPKRLTFYNLTNNQPVSSVRTSKDLAEARVEILEVAEKIRRRIFHPTPGFVCKWCDFVPICPAHEEVL